MNGNCSTTGRNSPERLPDTVQLEHQWKSIDWKKAEAEVSRLQARIAKATQEKKWNTVKRLQYLLSHSYYAKALAVRKVTTNKGKHTPGIDKELWNTPAVKMRNVLILTDKGYKAKPLRRVFIEKPGKKKKRPLGIPCMYDRAMQALYALALDPVSETTADEKSFGFRRGRSAQDACEYIFTALSRRSSPEWVLEGDIKGCFDHISHDWLIEHIPMDKSVLKQFLKAGFVFQNELFPTDEGTPQGGVISPILANMALDGMQKVLSDRFHTNRLGKIDLRFKNAHKVNLVRYANAIPSDSSECSWTISRIKSILTNEKYCGDVLLQKTYISDCLSKKVMKNTGQLPMYLVQNNHEGIVSRETFDAVQTEMARRNAAKSPSKKNASTGLTSYASKYAMSERLVCGECGTLYRRCTWVRNGEKRVVWRCVSRLDYGTKYCHNSPTLDEEPLQRAILAAINRAMSRKESLIQIVTGAMQQELAPIPGQTMSLADISRRLEQIDAETKDILLRSAKEQSYDAYTGKLKSLMNEAAMLKEKRGFMEQQRKENSEMARRIDSASAAMERITAALTQWDEMLIRQIVDTVRVASAEEIVVTLKNGEEIGQSLM